MLKGLGASLALPMLDSMIPALSAAAPSTPRLGWVYVSHGVIFDQWKPTKLGHGFRADAESEAARKLNGQFNILTGLSHLEADTKGDGSGDHTRASAAWLTGVHAYDRTRPGVEVKLATTADQLAAQVLGKNSQIPSIEMTVDTASAGSCDSGDCFYVNTVSWRNPTTPNMTRESASRGLRAPVRRRRLQRPAARARQENRQHSRFGDARKPAAWPAASATATGPSSANIWIRFATSNSAFRAHENRRPRRISSCRIARSAFRTASKSTPS